MHEPGGARQRRRPPAHVLLLSTGASGSGQPWVTYPGLYTGQCKTSGGATWLQITAATGDTRPVVTPMLGPTWGLHLDDANLALGNLVDDVRSAEAAWTTAAPLSVGRTR